jgi:hypothetical protein
MASPQRNQDPGTLDIEDPDRYYICFRKFNFTMKIGLELNLQMDVLWNCYCIFALWKNFFRFPLFIALHGFLMAAAGWLLVKPHLRKKDTLLNYGIVRL